MLVIYIKPVQKFIDSLEPRLYGKVSRYIELLNIHGKALHKPFSKRIDKNLYELRILGAIHVRIFYTFSDEYIVLLHGFIKTTQKIPFKDLNTAKQRMKLLT